MVRLLSNSLCFSVACFALLRCAPLCSAVLRCAFLCSSMLLYAPITINHPTSLPRNSSALLPQIVIKLALRILARIVVWRHRRRDPTHQQHEEQTANGDTNHLPAHRVARTILCPHPMPLADILLQFIGTELVVHQPGEGDAVPESLEKRDRVAEDEHRGNDEEDILEDA